MAQDLINNDMHINGAFSCKTLVPPSGCIANAAVSANAAIDATKVVHQFPINYQQDPGGAVVAATKLLHIARASGTIVAIEAAVTTIATGADRTVTIDLLKGNTGSAFASVLTAAIVLDNTNTARTPEAGAITTTSYSDGDVLELTVAVAGAAGNQAEGLTVTIWLRENPQ